MIIKIVQTTLKLDMFELKSCSNDVLFRSIEFQSRLNETRSRLYERKASLNELKSFERLRMSFEQVIK